LYTKTKKKEIKLTDALLNQQTGEKRRFVTTPIFNWQERRVAGDKAGTCMIRREDSCGSWWTLMLD
jgi:hypothetical protein